MESIRLKARAKINLGLDVIGRRENGYHDVRMVMQTVGLYDRIIMTRIPEEEIRIKTNIGFLPVNENNLVYKAIMLMKNKYKLDDNLQIIQELDISHKTLITHAPCNSPRGEETIPIIGTKRG